MATDINILIKATDQALPTIKKVEGGLKDVGTQAKSSSSALSGVGNVLKTGLTTALIGTAAAFGGLVFAFKDSLGAAKESIEANKQLEQVIKSTGGAAGVTADQARDLATNLANMTNYQDDAIVSGENLLLTFTGIGKDVFPRATETMLDMSQALGQDLSSSAVQLGKALNDPINGMTALSRVGVSFSDQQKEMIATMQNANDIAGAQGVILDELSKEFGGSAKALADPATQLANAWGEVQEAVGMGLMPVLANLAQTVLPYVQAAANAVSTAVTNFYTNLDSGKGILQSARDAIAGVLPDDLKQKWLDLSGDIMGTLNTITGNVQNAMGWIKLAWNSNWADLHDTFQTFTTETPKLWVTFWEEFDSTFKTHSTGIQVNWESLWETLAHDLTARYTVMMTDSIDFLRILRGLWQAQGAFLEGDWATMWDNIHLAMTAMGDIIMNYVEFQFGAGMRTAFANALNSVWDTIKSWWNDVQNWWNSTVSPFFGGVSLPTPSFAVVNPANTGGASASAAGGTTNNIVVNTTGGYDSGVAAGDGIVDAMRFRGH